MSRNLWLAGLMAVTFPVAAAAGEVVAGSAAIGSSFEVTAPLPAGGATLAPTTLTLATPFVGGVTYRPRHYASPRKVMPITTQIHVGFFDPNDDIDPGFDGGFRIGPQVNPNVQIGMAMDWWHRSEEQELSLGTIEGPGGTVQELLLLSRSTLDLVPMLAFVQVSGDENLPVIPYGGVGVGYEWLFLGTDDYFDDPYYDDWTDQTFGGFGWQLWGGLGVPLSGQMRLNAEVFYNGCEVASDLDVYLEQYGVVTVRDVIEMNGVGMRFGLAWGF